MDIKIADRLQAIRKKHGYSQEELADKLNVSRQAVSKWERGDASPDTDNLIALAKIYNITIDELLNGDVSVPEIEKPIRVIVEEDKNEDEDNLNSKQKLILSIVSGSSLLFATIIYLAFGFCFNLWHPLWIVFLILPFSASLTDAILKKNPRNFAYPVVVAAVYVLSGFFTGLWHPLWIMFLTIPIYYLAIDAFVFFNKRK